MMYLKNISMILTKLAIESMLFLFFSKKIPSMRKNIVTRRTGGLSSSNATNRMPRAPRVMPVYMRPAGGSSK